MPSRTEWTKSSTPQEQSPPLTKSRTPSPESNFLVDLPIHDGCHRKFFFRNSFCSLAFSVQSCQYTEFPLSRTSQVCISQRETVFVLLPCI
ncbi:hypothetical protein RvY_12828 [Ramazzottius varieornatus]|uniref:Uncharacterized protein n=1 Tax=Ramazzottius varieornatus TaxID=947166 RepID=A0A1D1VN36_RAMVA|nr:hypothetical protein RvY_12828 [Ramazzottius varieornatus]